MKHGNSLIFLQPYKYINVAIEIIPVTIAIIMFTIDSIYISFSNDSLLHDPIFIINKKS